MNPNWSNFSVGAPSSNLRCLGLGRKGKNLCEKLFRNEQLSRFWKRQIKNKNSCKSSLKKLKILLRNKLLAWKLKKKKLKIKCLAHTVTLDSLPLPRRKIIFCDSKIRKNVTVHSKSWKLGTVVFWFGLEPTWTFSWFLELWDYSKGFCCMQWGDMFLYFLFHSTHDSIELLVSFFEHNTPYSLN